FALGRVKVRDPGTTLITRELLRGVERDPVMRVNNVETADSSPRPSTELRRKRAPTGIGAIRTVDRARVRPARGRRRLQSQWDDRNIAVERAGSDVLASPRHDDGDVDVLSPERANQVVTGGPGAARDERVDLPHQHCNSGRAVHHHVNPLTSATAAINS